MNKRPLAITIISWLFIAVGAVALVYHLLPRHIGELQGRHQFEHELLWVCLVRLLAIVSGAFMLLRFNWARWLLVVWLAYHVALSAFHSAFETVVHSLLFGVILYFLFLPQANAYFRKGTVEPPEVPRKDEREA